MKNRGQSTIFIIVLLPLLLLIFGVIVRCGKLLLEHNRLQSHCDKKVLDAVMWQGRELELLGKLNPYAKTIIDSRRMIDALLAQGVLDPPSIPPLLRARHTLIKTQKAVDTQQKKIIAFSVKRSAQEIQHPLPSYFLGKIKEEMKPHLPLPAHRSPDSILLHIQKQGNYLNEEGAPLEMDRDFHQRQRENLKINMYSERFLKAWAPLPVQQNMELKCQSQIQMEQLEGPWQAVLL